VGSQLESFFLPETAAIATDLAQLRDCFTQKRAPAAKTWAENQQPAEHAELLLTLWAAEWGARDFDAAIAWARSTSSDWALLAACATTSDDIGAATELAEWTKSATQTAEYRADLALQLLESAGNPTRALVVLDQLGEEARERHETQVLTRWAQDKPLAALDYAVRKPNLESHLLEILREWPEDKLDLLTTGLSALPLHPPAFRATALARLSRAAALPVQKNATN